MSCALCRLLTEKRAVYDDGACFAFTDDKPQGRTHITIASKTCLPDNLLDDRVGDEWTQRLLRATRRVLKKLELKRYRLVINHNIGRIRHLHVHVISVP